MNMPMYLIRSRLSQKHVGLKSHWPRRRGGGGDGNILFSPTQAACHAGVT